MPYYLHCECCRMQAWYKLKWYVGTKQVRTDYLCTEHKDIMVECFDLGVSRYTSLNVRVLNKRERTVKSEAWG
jgi:hypothetical protein